jgi:hypothetical protein
MAHGEVARQIFERLLQDGNTWYRPGWGPSIAASPMLSASPCSRRYLQTFERAGTLLEMDNGELIMENASTSDESHFSKNNYPFSFSIFHY